jgi:hypothetical protein
MPDKRATRIRGDVAGDFPSDQHSGTITGDRGQDNRNTHHVVS